MSAVPGNTRVIYAAKQSAKGTPATTPTHKFTLSGDASLNPGRSIITLPETDAFMQEASSVVVGSRPTGGWQGWMRFSEFAWLAHMCLGADADSGAGPYVHTATPVQAIPYITFWDTLPGSMCTQYVDGWIGSLGASGESLAGIQYTVEAGALSAVLNATEPTVPAASATDAALAYPGVVVTVGAVHPGTHDAFSITINRNVTVLGGDNGLGVFDRAVGVLAVEGTFRRIYENDDAYNQYHGGSAGATALTPTIFSEALDLGVVVGANSVHFTSNAIQYTETTIPVNTDGAPVVMARSFRTQRQATVANNISVVTTNALATSLTTPA